ncbi:MAG: PAQR family membrane homeostasis protein TrhA [Alphaproteobacteria bacterium]
MLGADEFPKYTTAEWRVDAAIHAAGISFGVMAALWLFWHAIGNSAGGSLALYGLCLVVMLVASALYNLTPASRLKEWMRRADHSAIYLMIAGTYTPFALNSMAGPAGIAIAVIVWLTAILGVVLSVIYARRFEAFKIVLYLAMGWMILPAIVPLYRSISEASLWLLLGGGVIYSAGSVVYLLRKLPFHNALWHLMVLVAASLHFTAMVIEFVL